MFKIIKQNLRCLSFLNFLGCLFPFSPLQVNFAIPPISFLASFFPRRGTGEEATSPKGARGECPNYGGGVSFFPPTGRRGLASQEKDSENIK